MFSQEVELRVLITAVTIQTICMFISAVSEQLRTVAAAVTFSISALVLIYYFSKLIYTRSLRRK